MPKPLRIATVVAALSLVALPSFAQRGDDTNRKSKNGQTTGTVGGVAVTIDYGRPNVAGRAVWGGLVPYDQVWRTGADEATTITFGAEATIEGQKLAAGKYSLFTIPGATTWTVIFNKTADQWGAYKYDATADALRVTVKPRVHEAVETLTFSLAGDEVVLTWEKLAVGFRVGKG